MRALAAAMLMLLAALSCSSCSTSPARLESPARTTAWSASFSPPLALETARVRLEPLGPQHAELDHAAVMASREHLNRTLHWGTWPPEGFTLEEDRADLEEHWREFRAGEGYAFTVLSPERARCLGCVYMTPPADVDQEPRTMILYWWVVAEELYSSLDVHVLQQVLGWIEVTWPFDRVAVPVHLENFRGAEVARSLGLRQGELQAEHQIYWWERSTPP